MRKYFGEFFSLYLPQKKQLFGGKTKIFRGFSTSFSSAILDFLSFYNTSVSNVSSWGYLVNKNPPFCFGKTNNPNKSFPHSGGHFVSTFPSFAIPVSIFTLAEAS